jgi:hypothetical protein
MTHLAKEAYTAAFIDRLSRKENPSEILLQSFHFFLVVKNSSDTKD